MPLTKELNLSITIGSPKYHTNLASDHFEVTIIGGKIFLIPKGYEIY